MVSERPLITGAALIVALWACLAIAPPVNAEEPLDLSALRGQVVYLDFWASWCAPCRQSFPWMNHLQSELRQDGLVVIAVNVDRERADAERFLSAHPADFRIVFDPRGELPEKFGVRGMPTSFLIDRSGQVRLRHDGFFVRDSDALARQVRMLVIGQN